MRELIGTTAVTNHVRIRAKKIIVTTHFPFLNTHSSYFLKLYQRRSYVIALKNTPDVDGMYWDKAQAGMSFGIINICCSSGAETTALVKKVAVGRNYGIFPNGITRKRRSTAAGPCRAV